MGAGGREQLLVFGVVRCHKEVKSDGTLEGQVGVLWANKGRHPGGITVMGNGRGYRCSYFVWKQ